MNSSFKLILKNSGMSMYGLAKNTGLPYTTINRLVNEKLDINDCNAAAVYKIAKALGVTMEQLVRNYDFLTGTEGKYLGVKYKWTKDNENHQLLVLVDREQEVVAWQGRKLLTKTDNRYLYRLMVEQVVENYLNHKASQARLKELAEKYG